VVTSDATNPVLTVPFTGTGTPPGTAVLSAGPASVAFGNQVVNSTSAARAVTITNTGTAVASLSGTSISGEFQIASNDCVVIAVSASCTVNVTFRPTSATALTGTLSFQTDAITTVLTVALSGTGVAATTGNLAAGKPTSESSHQQTYRSANAVDGQQATYWESANHAFPQWVQVDLGSAKGVGRVVLKLPAPWGARSQTLSVLGSTSNSPWSTLKPSASYRFSPSSANTVTITFTTTSVRYLRIKVSANSVQPGGQVSELEVYTA
jgi:hypothetical protein